MMSNIVIHKADTRGTSNKGWLHSRHSFSFGNYFDSQRLHFGALRVINEELMAPGKGYGSHPHSNIEILIIPLEGEIEYKDEFNNKNVIRPGDIQVISAGSGIFHQLINVSKENSARYLNIWILPQFQKLTPRLTQTSYSLTDNAFTEIISSHLHQNKIWIYQDVWIGIANITSAECVLKYELQRPRSNGVYVFVIDGSLQYEDMKLTKRDGMAVTDISEMNFSTQTTCRFLLIEVPLKV